MNERNNTGIHWSIWLIGVAALIWNGLGIFNYFMQMDAEALSAMPDSHRAIVEGRPAWATGGFAVAVFLGALGCVLLLFRKSAAIFFLIVSLLGVLVQLVHTLNVVRSEVVFTSSDIFMIVVLPVAVAALLAVYSRWTADKGWIA